MMSRSVALAFILQICDVAGSFLSRGAQEEDKLPEVKEVVAKPTEVLNHLRTGVGELAEQLNAAEDMTTKAVSKKKEEFEMKLKHQKQEIGGVAMTNAVIAQRINDLRSSSDTLRLQANQLLKENKEVRQEMFDLQANMTTAQDFSDIALASAKAKIDNATELNVLRQLDEEDAARAENASRYRALQEIHVANKKMAMLEFGAGPSSTPQEMLQTLMSTLTTLANAENASLMSLQKQFDEQFQDGVKKYHQLLADQAQLNSTWANESETNRRLVVAVNHLKDTQVQVKKDLTSVRQYVQKLVSLSSGKTGVSTSPAAKNVTMSMPSKSDFAIEKFHASQKAAFAENQEQKAKEEAAKKALAKKTSMQASTLVKEAKAEAAKEAIEKALAHAPSLVKEVKAEAAREAIEKEKAKTVTADAGKKTQDCRDACYSARHKDVPWSGHRCLWKNCHECAECAQGARSEASEKREQKAIVSAKNVYTLRQKLAKLVAEDKKLIAKDTSCQHCYQRNGGNWDILGGTCVPDKAGNCMDESHFCSNTQGSYSGPCKQAREMATVKAVNAAKGSLDEESKLKAVRKLLNKAKRAQAKRESQTIRLEDEVNSAPKTGTATKANHKAEEKNNEKAKRTARRNPARAETKAKGKGRGKSMEAKGKSKAKAKGKGRGRELKGTLPAEISEDAANVEAAEEFSKVFNDLESQRCVWTTAMAGYIKSQNLEAITDEKLTLEECQNRCFSNLQCKSIDYGGADGSCFLNDCRIGDGECVNEDPGDTTYQYYSCEGTQLAEISEDAANVKALEKLSKDQMSNAQVVQRCVWTTGTAGYIKAENWEVIMDETLTLEKCQNLCSSNSQCESIDYGEADKSCFLNYCRIGDGECVNEDPEDTTYQYYSCEAAQKEAEVKDVEKFTKAAKASTAAEAKHVEESSSAEEASESPETPTSAEEASESSRTAEEPSKKSWFSWLMR